MQHYSDLFKKPEEIAQEIETIKDTLFQYHQDADVFSANKPNQWPWRNAKDCQGVRWQKPGITPIRLSAIMTFKWTRF